VILRPIPYRTIPKIHECTKTVQCQSSEIVICNASLTTIATKYKHASSLVSHKTVKSRKPVEKYNAKNMINATNGHFFQTTIPISLPFRAHHSHSHEFSLCFPFPWDSRGTHGTHGNSRIMHTARMKVSKS